MLMAHCGDREPHSPQQGEFLGAGCVASLTVVSLAGHFGLEWDMTRLMV